MPILIVHRRPQVTPDPPGVWPDDVGSFGNRMYASLEPMAWDDENQGWALLAYCGAWGTMFQWLEDLARDQDGRAGWSLLVDVDRCPVDALPWLAQIAGVQISEEMTEAQIRQMIHEENNWYRGTVRALRSSATRWLTGSKRCMILERQGSAYRLTAVTWSSETPFPVKTLSSLGAAKAGGLLLDYVVIPGKPWSWADVINQYATWTAVQTSFATWEDVAQDNPT